MNLPNAVTAGRLLLTLGYLALLEFALIRGKGGAVILDIAAGIFIIAVLTDVLDGYLARKFNMQTLLGRMMDPFVDKILICGSLVYFSADDTLSVFVPVWLVVLVLAREFLVSVLRSFAEGKGVVFPSRSIGKEKMVLQSVTVAALLVFGANAPAFAAKMEFIPPVLHGLVYFTVFMTLLSGLVYVVDFTRKLKDSLF